jgi:bifunctional non-homologous end joining protein LigD
MTLEVCWPFHMVEAHLPSKIKYSRHLSVYNLHMSRNRSNESFGQPYLWEVEWARLRYVLRRHHATRLHWDFRIEANGMLYSWWMYQPPSMNPLITVAVGLSGFHDPKHINSERRIEDGQPGAGPTLVEEMEWVKPISSPRMSQSRALHEQFCRGRMVFEIEGTKLRGTFLLEGKNEQWQMRKLDDQHASVSEPTWTGQSVISGQRLEDLERNYLEQTQRSSVISSKAFANRQLWIDPMI